MSIPNNPLTSFVHKSPGGHDAHLRSLKSHLSQVVCGKPMGYVINSNNLEDLHVMMFERYKVFTIGSGGGGGGGGGWMFYFSNYGSLPLRMIPTNFS